MLCAYITIEIFKRKLFKGDGGWGLPLTIKLKKNKKHTSKKRKK